jgi:hypothetical protein
MLNIEVTQPKFQIGVLCNAVLRPRNDREIAEMRHTVGLGPKRHFAGAREGGVGRGEQHLTVMGNRKTIIGRLKPERMPHAGSHLDGGALYLMARTPDDTIKVHIVFERVGPNDVVVVGIG